MNYKAITLVFIFQVIAGVLWYASTPISFLGRPVFDDVSQRPTIEIIVLFALSAFVYLLFVAWLLTQIQRMSFFGRFFLVIGIWCFVLLPNYFVVSLQLGINQSESLYLLSYSLVNSLLIAIILPLWRSSRSIFKD